jgi:hypothetical protein
MKLNKYSLPLRVAAVMLLMLSLATMAAAALSVAYGIDQGYYEQDFNHYFETEACRGEAWSLAVRVCNQMERSTGAGGLTNREILDLYYGPEQTNAYLTVQWEGEEALVNRADPPSRILYSADFTV